MKIVTSIRESILNAEDKKTLSRMTQVADIMAAQLDEIPERTKRGWKLAQKRAESRLQKEQESGEAKPQKVSQKANTGQRKRKLKSKSQSNTS
tara:strand:+ start:4808 stop:5086 length:279 start_codon:yes stop_codon:yes gene_type:complete